MAFRIPNPPAYLYDPPKPQESSASSNTPFSAPQAAVTETIQASNLNSELKEFRAEIKRLAFELQRALQERRTAETQFAMLYTEHQSLKERALHSEKKRLLIARFVRRVRRLFDEHRERNRQFFETFNQMKNHVEATETTVHELQIENDSLKSQTRLHEGVETKLAKEVYKLKEENISLRNELENKSKLYDEMQIQADSCLFEVRDIQVAVSAAQNRLEKVLQGANKQAARPQASTPPNLADLGFKALELGAGIAADLDFL